MTFYLVCLALGSRDPETVPELETRDIEAPSRVGGMKRSALLGWPSDGSRKTFDEVYKWNRFREAFDFAKELITEEEYNQLRERALEEL